MQKLAIAALSFSVLSGCVTSNLATQGFSGISGTQRLLLMPPDIKYYQVTASGISEPQADWTTRARQSFDTVFAEYAASVGLDVTAIARDDVSDAAYQYDKLHSAVGATILLNHFGNTKLPSKKSREGSEYTFDWSLGSGVADLAQGSDERYALFVYFRDYQASGGRIGMVVFAAILGVPTYAGHQGGFASLVDLESGKVVWFNDVPFAQGDMRSPDGARKLVEQLFADLAAPAG